MPFTASIQDVFSLPGKGTVLWLSDVAGELEKGERFETDLGEAVVLEVCEPGIRDRSCLTGRKVPPYAAILTDLPMPKGKDLHKTIIRTT